MGKNMNKLKNLQKAAKTKNKDEIERAFEEFYMMNYSLVCYIVNGYIHSPSDVEDVVETLTTYVKKSVLLVDSVNPKN